MEKNRFSTAGWLAIAGAIMVLPLMVSALILDIVYQKTSYMNPFIATLFLGFNVTQIAFVLFAFYRFKAYLNEVLQFRKTDLLILIIIAGMIVLSAIGITGRIVAWMGAPDEIKAIFVALIASFGIPLGILSVVFGIKILDIQDCTSRLLRPYAWLNIAGGVCFATFILAPFGMLLASAGDVLMGLILLGKGPVASPDFV